MKLPIRLFVITALFLLHIQSMPGQTVNNIWDKTFGGSSRDWNCQIVKSSDGSLFLVGDSQSDISGNKNLTLCNASVPNADIWIIKTDTAGNILWQKDLGGEADERNPQLLPLNNSSKQLLLCCHSTSDVACDKTEPNRDTVPLLSPDYWICLLDSNGNKLWDVTLGGDNYDDYTQAGMFSNGDFLISGESNSPVGYDKSSANYSISNDLWTLRLDQNGNKLWDRVYGGTGGEFLSSVIMLPGGDFILTGSTSSDVSGDVSQPSQGSFDYWMIKVDGSGNKIWDKRFGGSGGERNLKTIQTPDNGFLMTGFTVSPQSGDVSEAPKGLQDIWIVKTDDQGNKLWDKRYGGTNLTIGTWVENAPGGGYWVMGYTDSDGILDISQASFGGSDYWVMLIDSVGNKKFDQRFGGTGNEFSSSFTLLSDSTLMLFGYADTGYSSTKTDTSYGWLDYWMVKLTVGNIGTFDFTEHFQNQLSVYPNPVNSTVNIRFSANSSNPYNLIITDISGKAIYQQTGKLESENHISVDLKNIEAGMYLVHIESESFSIQERFTVVR